MRPVSGGAPSPPGRRPGAARGRGGSGSSTTPGGRGCRRWRRGRDPRPGEYVCPRDDAPLIPKRAHSSPAVMPSPPRATMPLARPTSQATTAAALVVDPRRRKMSGSPETAVARNRRHAVRNSRSNRSVARASSSPPHRRHELIDELAPGAGGSRRGRRARSRRRSAASTQPRASKTTTQASSLDRTSSGVRTHGSPCGTPTVTPTSRTGTKVPDVNFRPPGAQRP